MSYKTVRKELAERMGADNAHELPCSDCAAPTPIKTLSDYGGKCFGCCQANCREPSRPYQRSHYAERVRAEIAAMGKKVPA